MRLPRRVVPITQLHHTKLDELLSEIPILSDAPARFGLGTVLWMGWVFLLASVQMLSTPVLGLTALVTLVAVWQARRQGVRSVLPGAGGVGSSRGILTALFCGILDHELNKGVIGPGLFTRRSNDQRCVRVRSVACILGPYSNAGITNSPLPVVFVNGRSS